METLIELRHRLDLLDAHQKGMKFLTYCVGVSAFSLGMTLGYLVPR